MKKCLLALGLLLVQGIGLSQSDEINNRKYWKFRNELRENFMKIGAEEGQSLPAGAIVPCNCVDTWDYGEDGTGFGASKYSKMVWGDGMIRHGYYLGLLATEYRLLKDAQQDVTGVLNELYYALHAVNRLDLYAEEKLDFVYNFPYPLPQNLNGFYMREDIGEDFAVENWLNTRYKSACVSSAHYETNNSGKMNYTDQWNTYFTKGNSYQNVPSLDQMTALMLGFSLIHKLVDDVHVKPTANDAGFQVVTETKAIVHRIMTYVNNRNWQIIGIDGWPVANGGGDLILAAYPLSVAAKRITGNDYVADISRKLGNLKLGDVQYCLTGFGVTSDDPIERQNTCDDINSWALTFAPGYETYQDLLSAVPPGTLNNQNTSRFQQWQKGEFDIGLFDQTFEFDYNHTRFFLWEQLTANALGDILDEFMSEQTISVLPNPLDDIKWKKIEIKHYNLTILGNLGAASGLWDPAVMKKYTDLTQNFQLELINAVIRSQTPANSKTHFEAMLNNQKYYGSFNFRESIGNGAFYNLLNYPYVSPTSINNQVLIS